MQHIASRLMALTLVSLLVACGAEQWPSAPRGQAAVPVASPSWIAGDAERPTSGHVVVGLLLKHATPRRLADMVPKAKLEEYLNGDWIEPPLEEIEEEEEVYFEREEPTYRAWGREGGRLYSVRDWFREEQGVNIVFREVLANECDTLPIVLIEDRPITRAEKTALDAYRASGGIVQRLRKLTVKEARVSPATIARLAIRDAIKRSNRIHRLDQDPFALRATREGDRVLIDAPMPGLSVALEDAQGHALRDATTLPDGRLAIYAPDAEQNPYSHHIVSTYRGTGFTLRRAMPLERLVGTVARDVFTGDRATIGGVLAARVHTRTSHDQAVMPGQAGHLRLFRGETELASVAYTTDAHGLAHPRLRVPGDIKPGPAEIEVDGVRRGVTLGSDLRISVVTDRRLYKETDKVHVRVMAHRQADGRPVPDATITLRMGDVRRDVITSTHGIASHAFELVDEKVGGKRIKASGGGAKAEAAFRVKAFERPTFTVAIEPAELTLEPGAAAPVKVIATYVNGSPLVAGTLSHDVRGTARIQGKPTSTDEEGVTEAIVRAGSKAGTSIVTLTVRDADGRRIDTPLRVQVGEHKPAVTAVAISDIAIGVPARFDVQGPGPGTATVTLDNQQRDVVLDESGYGTIELIPQKVVSDLSVTMEGAEPYRKRLATEEPGLGFKNLDVVVALDRRTARVGETIEGTVLGPDGVLLLDVWRDATPVYTGTLTITEGRARLRIPVDAAMAGVVRLHTTHLESGQVGPRRSVLITRGRALEVTAVPDQADYRPGATASLDLRITDHQGRPTAAVLGYYGVDEALLALAPMTEGHERIFDVLDGVTGGLAADALRTDREQTVPSESLASRLGDFKHSMSHARSFPIHIKRTPALIEASKLDHQHTMSGAATQLQKAYIAAWHKINPLDMLTSQSVREAVTWLVERGSLAAEPLIDPWGMPYALWTDRSSTVISWVSGGPDRVLGTADDQRASWDIYLLYDALPERLRSFHAFIRHTLRELRGELEEDAEETEEVEEKEIVTEEPVIKDEEIWDEVETDNDLPFEESFGETEGLSDAPFAVGDAPFEGPSTNGTIGIGGGAGGAFFGRGGSRDVTAGGGGRRTVVKPLYIRKDFDPTLCFVPEAIVGPDGRTTLTVPLKDSITTWRMRYVASNANGAVGVGRGSLRVTQPVHATPWLSPHLTVDDVVTVPVAVRNERREAITARVMLTPSAELRQLAEPLQTLAIAPGGTARATFRLRAVARGDARVRIVVDTGAHQDKQERIIHVHPNSRRIVDVANGRITADAPFPTAMGSDGPGEVRLEICPTPMAQVLSGFEGLIRCPHG